MPSPAPMRVSVVPSASTCPTTVARLTPMARSVAISPSRSFTVMVRRVAMSSTVTMRLMLPKMKESWRK